MKKKEYTTPQIEVIAMDIAPVLDAVSIAGEPTGGGGHNIAGAKSMFDIYDNAPDDEE